MNVTSEFATTFALLNASTDLLGFIFNEALIQKNILLSMIWRSHFSGLFFYQLFIFLSKFFYFYIIFLDIKAFLEILNRVTANKYLIFIFIFFESAGVSGVFLAYFQIIINESIFVSF